MATLTELRKRFKGTPNIMKSRLGSDELLVADLRGQMSPSRCVEEKFRAIMALRLPGERVRSAGAKAK